jgi:chorismate mutase
MSATPDRISELRAGLLAVNRSWLQLIQERRSLSAQIQQCKEGDWNYDPQRETQIFAALSEELKTLSLGELASFSLLMEAQAQAPLRYPQWSLGEHLLAPTRRLEELINPLLLREYSMDMFKSLKLKAEYSFLLSI